MNSLFRFRDLEFKALEYRVDGIGWVLPPLCNSWIIYLYNSYIALNMTFNMDCCRVGAVPKV